ncbi:MAG: transporter [Planctomycetota bacterium]
MRRAAHARSRRPSPAPLPGFALGLALVVGGPPANAQEANLTPAATQPAKGRITLKSQYRWTRYIGNERDVSEHRIDHRLQFGVSRTVVAQLTVPTIARVDLLDGGSDDDDNGLGDARFTMKWRFWQADPGGLDTTRASVFGGVELPTGTGDLSSHSVDPYMGAVFMIVRGRHGVSQSLSYQFNTGTDRDNIGPGTNADDVLELGTAYLFRLSPARWGPDSHGAWYLAGESELFYETNGDTEWLLSPGVLYEGMRWAGELGVRLPVVQRVDNRPETDWGWYAGLRVLF